ncbi:MAG TPA: hypothetical protein VI160_09910 [Gemmatimonadales bacterium]
MLSTATNGAPARAARRPPRSQKQEYQEFLLQRIEEYKNTVAREVLLRIGDEAVRELEAATAQQYLLTEVLLLEHVDRIIARRLKLPSFKKWAQSHRALRAAQREPTHWGIDADHPIVACARRLEPGDEVVVVGAGALPVALFAAAHDVEVLLLDQDLGAVEASEGRAVAEQLAGRFRGLLVNFGGWLPDLHPAVAVLDPAALALAAPHERDAFVSALKATTLSGGVHIVSALDPDAPEVLPLAPEALQSAYVDWQIERRKRRKRGEGFVATKLPRQNDTSVNVSE